MGAALQSDWRCDWEHLASGDPRDLLEKVERAENHSSYYGSQEETFSGIAFRSEWPPSLKCVGCSCGQEPCPAALASQSAKSEALERLEAEAPNRRGHRADWDGPRDDWESIKWCATFGGLGRPKGLPYAHYLPKGREVIGPCAFARERLFFNQRQSRGDFRSLTPAQTYQMIAPALLPERLTGDATGDATNDATNDFHHVAWCPIDCFFRVWCPGKKEYHTFYWSDEFRVRGKMPPTVQCCGCEGYFDVGEKEWQAGRVRPAVPVEHRNKRARATDFDDEQTDAAEQQKVKCPRSGDAIS